MVANREKGTSVPQPSIEADLFSHNLRIQGRGARVGQPCWSQKNSSTYAPLWNSNIHHRLEQCSGSPCPRQMIQGGTLTCVFFRRRTASRPGGWITFHGVTLSWEWSREKGLFELSKLSSLRTTRLSSVQFSSYRWKRNLKSILEMEELIDDNVYEMSHEYLITFLTIAI